MSVVHQGMPEIAMLRPARTCWRSDSQVAGMSPDQTAAPNRCAPAQAERHSRTVGVLAGRGHALGEEPGVVARVDAGDLRAGPRVQGQVAGVRRVELRLAGVEPEDADAAGTGSSARPGPRRARGSAGWSGRRTPPAWARPCPCPGWSAGTPPPGRRPPAAPGRRTRRSSRSAVTPWARPTPSARRRAPAARRPWRRDRATRPGRSGSRPWRTSGRSRPRSPTAAGRGACTRGPPTSSSSCVR